MERELTEVYCGNGKGKTALAIGQSLREATQGKSVIVIQFLNCLLYTSDAADE